MVRLGIDVDGVLASFNVGYIKLLRQYTGLEVPDESITYPDSWDYDKDLMRKAGWPAEKISATTGAIWALIRNSKDFWSSLPAYPQCFLFLRNIAELDVDTYFITSRPGNTSKAQTELWLADQGYDYLPTVLVTQTKESTKGAICHALGITHYIDDKNENCLDVEQTSPGTKGIMLAAPWNKQVGKTPRHTSLGGFLDCVYDDIPNVQ